MKVEVVLVLTKNVERLMKARGDSQKTLADRAGVSQRAVGDLLTYGRGHFKNPTLKTLGGLGYAYDVPPWMLLLPDLPIELAQGRQLIDLIESFRDVPGEGRENILRVARGEVRYARATQPLEKTGTGH